jgi:hypothetical protein
MEMVEGEEGNLPLCTCPCISWADKSKIQVVVSKAGWELLPRLSFTGTAS